MRFSSNALRRSFEAGTTSNWLVTFENVVGSKANFANSLNLIKQSQGGNFFPAQDVDYNQVVIGDKQLEVGPGLQIHIPTFSEPPQSINITFFETHKKDITNVMRNWVGTSGLKKRQAPSNLKSIAMKVIIWYFDKELNSLPSYSKDVYYVVPKGVISVKGDQTFSLDTNVMSLAIIGTE